MPSALTSPGVYIEELPSAVRTITGVPTSITAFVGRAWRGPVDEPITIDSFSDFERTFGGLWRSSTLSYAVQHFFLNGGARGWALTRWPASSTVFVGQCWAKPPRTAACCCCLLS